MMAPGKFRPSQVGGRCSNAIMIDCWYDSRAENFLAIVIAPGLSIMPPALLRFSWAMKVLDLVIESQSETKVFQTIANYISDFLF